MPKKTEVQEIEKNKIYCFESTLSLYSGGNCIIRAPMSIGKIYPNSKIRVTIEILKDD